MSIFPMSYCPYVSMSRMSRMSLKFVTLTYTNFCLYIVKNYVIYGLTLERNIMYVK